MSSENNIAAMKKAITRLGAIAQTQGGGVKIDMKMIPTFLGEVQKFAVWRTLALQTIYQFDQRQPRGVSTSEHSISHPLTIKGTTNT